MRSILGSDFSLQFFFNYAPADNTVQRNDSNTRYV